MCLFFFLSTRKINHSSRKPVSSLQNICFSVTKLEADLSTKMVSSRLHHRMSRLCYKVLSC